MRDESELVIRDIELKNKTVKTLSPSHRFFLIWRNVPTIVLSVIYRTLCDIYNINILALYTVSSQ